MSRTSTPIDWAKPIAYAVASRNYTTLHYPDGTSLFCAYTLSVVHGHFPELVRMCRGAIVRIDFIKRYEFRLPEREMIIRLKDGVEMSVAHPRRLEVIMLLKNIK